MEESKLSARCRLDYFCNLLVAQEFTPGSARHTKLAATIGPNCSDAETLEQMMLAGLDVVRINLSYTAQDDIREYFKNIRLAQANFSKKFDILRPIAIAVQTKGPEIRTGYLEGGKGVYLKKGDTFKLSTDKAFYTKGNHSVVYVDYENIQKIVTVGNRILLDYSHIELICTGIQGSYVITVVETPGELNNYKNVKIPGTLPEMLKLTEKDRQDLMLCIELKADIIIISFINEPSLLLDVNELLGPYRENVLLLSKLDRFYSIEKFEEVLNASDGFVLTRYELTIEEPIQTAGTIIKKIVNLCKKANKPIMFGSELMRSLCKKTYPKPVESVNFASAIYDGFDCVCTNITATNSEQPIEVIKIMDKMAKSVEKSFYDTEPFVRNYLSTKNLSVIETIAEAAVQSSIKLQAAAIIVVSPFGDESKYLSKYRPRCPILASTHNRALAQRLNFIRGVIPIQLKVPDIDMSNTKLYIDTIADVVIRYGQANGIIKLGDPIIFTYMTLDSGDYSTVMCIQYATDLAEPIIINDWKM